MMKKVVRIDGLNKRGVNCFIKDFRKHLLQNESLTNNSDKHLRKAIKQSNKTVKEFERKRDLHTDFILVHSIPELHPVLIQFSIKPLSSTSKTPQDRTPSAFIGFQQQTICNMNNYKILNKIESTWIYRTRDPM